jgi:ABC-2 type transport system ATP-binding protein
MADAKADESQGNVGASPGGDSRLGEESMSQVVEVIDLHKSFRPHVFGPTVQALRGVSFEVREGECFGYLGQNGAGKTTTMKVLTGLMTPSRGVAMLLGRRCGDEGARRALGYLPENPYFYEHLTPREALQFYGRLAGLSSRDVAARTPSLLERVRLSDAADRRIRGFSKGMRQRFGLAAALVHEPALVMLDEPLNGLDPGGRQLVKELILEERRKGRTVFLCSHVLADVQELCDRVVVLHGGVVAREGSMHDLLDSKPRSHELTVARAPSELVAKIRAAATSVREVEGVVTAVLPGPDAGPDFAARVAAAGGRVLALVPERETLESWFVRLTSAQPAGDVADVLEPAKEAVR